MYASKSSLKLRTVAESVCVRERERKRERERERERESECKRQRHIFCLRSCPLNAKQLSCQKIFVFQFLAFLTVYCFFPPPKNFFFFFLIGMLQERTAASWPTCCQLRCHVSPALPWPSSCTTSTLPPSSGCSTSPSTLPGHPTTTTIN